MNRRIAHRPRYRNTHYPLHSFMNTHKQFLQTRWSYRKQQLTYEKRALGHSLTLIPLNYRLMRSIIVYQ
ncbi:MAG: hypothetical protein J2P37_22895 [Ktedonobacteraceae bacterium]|nr:hypothetical protein [Ktedonobacteraceae bacterium]MBO0789770.1 hypothetical protein [Ktedonobacteraceae bacterium]